MKGLNGVRVQIVLGDMLKRWLETKIGKHINIDIILG
jgi:hypothetical protein